MAYKKIFTSSNRGIKFDLQKFSLLQTGGVSFTFRKEKRLFQTNFLDKGLISEDRSNKATLQLTIPRRLQSIYLQKH